MSQCSGFKTKGTLNGAVTINTREPTRIHLFPYKDVVAMLAHVNVKVNLTPGEDWVLALHRLKAFYNHFSLTPFHTLSG